MFLDVLDYLKEKKALATIILGGLLALAALGIAAAVHGCSSAGAGAENESGAETQQGTPETTEPASEVRLGELQRALAKDSPYADALIVGVLGANTWANASGTATLDFTENLITERIGGEETKMSFVVVNIYEEAGTVYEDGVQIEEGTWLLDCVGADGDFFFIQVYRAGNGEGMDMVVKSSVFRSGSFLRVAPADNIAVEGLGEDAAALIGGKTELLGFVLCDYCSLNFPTATRAAYGGSSNVDFAKGTVEMTFTIDNAARTVLKVVYDTQAGTFKVGR